MGFLKHFAGEIAQPFIEALSLNPHKNKYRRHHRKGAMVRWAVFFHSDDGKRKHHNYVRATTRGGAMAKAKRIGRTFGGKGLLRVTVGRWS